MCSFLNLRGADYHRDVCYNWGLGMLVIVGLQVITGGAGCCKGAVCDRGAGYFNL